MLMPVKKTSLSDLVTDNVRQAILDGTFKPGERIIEEDLAGTLQTSRQPVRDALLQLEQEGLVVREKSRGATVVTMSAEDIEEVCSFRMSLETLAFRFAVQRATASDIAELETQLDRLAACLRRPDFSLEEAVELDLEFHEQLLRLSRHRRILSAWQGLRSQIWFLIFSLNAYRQGGYPSSSDVWHQNLIHALRQKDIAGGTDHLQRHLEISYDALLEAHRARESHA